MNADERRIAMGSRFREVRVSQGMSLGDVEVKSRRKWIGVVVGSYERGNRAISAWRLCELAEFYGVDPGELLTGRATVRLDLSSLIAQSRAVTAQLESLGLSEDIREIGATA